MKAVTQPFQYAGGYPRRGHRLDQIRRPLHGSPELGRWTTQDPLRQLLQPVDANRYTYASNNPINLVDPSSADALGCGMAIAGAALFITAAVAFAPATFSTFAAGAAYYEV